MDNSDEIGPGLLAVFAALPDTRGRHGRRHPLPAILTLATVAMLAGARSLYAIGQWGRLQSPHVLNALGFTRSATPSVSTLHVVFRGLDVAAFEAALTTWAQARAPSERTVAIDGKGLRGIHGENLPGVRLVAAYCDEAGLVLAQKGGPVRNTP
jgi:hypothetical protein